MTTSTPNFEAPVIKSACGGTLQYPSEYPSAMFKGELVYFCNKACLKAFMQAREAFMGGEIEHPLEEEVVQNNLNERKETLI